MGALLVAVFTALVLYCILMLIYAYGWRRTNAFSIPGDFTPHTAISIIIPARNEAHNIGACLTAISRQDYPKDLLEVVVIDDYSEDNTAAIARGFSVALDVKVLALKDYTSVELNAYKKAALSLGVQQSSGTLIITTDADCTAPKSWLKNVAAIHEATNAAAVIAPVAFSPDKGVPSVFQSLDFMTMQGITAAVRYWEFAAMANGANFAFSRKAYQQVGGYASTTHLASGDDYHLLQKILRLYPKGACYLKATGAIVMTPPQPNWGSFLQQRIRWASKSGKDGDARLTAMLVLVYLFNILLLILTVTAFFFPKLWIDCGLVFGIKVAVELVLLWPVSRFFGKQRELIFFPLLQPLHIVYVVMAGFLGMVGKYNWKGRSVR